MVMEKRENILNIGKRIKKRRKEKGITIKRLSEYTGLSVGYLSNLENGVNSPTLDNLFKICEALDSKITDMIVDEVTGRTIIRKSNRKIHDYPEYNQQVAIIDFQRDNQIYEVITIYPGEVDQSLGWRHIYSEVCTVIHGVLTVKMDGTVYHLEEGDSIYIPEKTKHNIYNETEDICISYWVYERK